MDLIELFDTNHALTVRDHAELTGQDSEEIVDKLMHSYYLSELINGFDEPQYFHNGDPFKMFEPVNAVYS